MVTQQIYCTDKLAMILFLQFKGPFAIRRNTQTKTKIPHGSHTYIQLYCMYSHIVVIVTLKNLI